MSIFFRKCFIILLIFSGTQSAYAQEWEVGIWGGFSNYFGDLNTNTSFEFISPAGGLFGRYNAGTRFAFKLGINAGAVSFDDRTSKYPYQQARNLSFKSIIYDLSGHIEFNFFQLIKEKEQFSFTPYLLTGCSVFYFNPKAKYNSEWHPLQPLETEETSYKRINYAIPVGGGFKYSFNTYWSIHLEIVNHKTFTDYLDDVSTEYPDPVLVAQKDPLAQVLTDRSGEVGEPIGIEGKQRGDRMKNDDYLFAGIGISYTFRKLKCPRPATVFPRF